jgi:hypothetical protein
VETQAQGAADAAQLAAMQTRMVLTSRMRAGIGWFFWIAALSLINSGAYLFGATFTFVIGLGITQVVDAVITALAQQLGDESGMLRVIGLIIDICVAGAFALIGYAGRKGVRWPVIVGMVIYALDAILMLVARDILGAAFHAWALFAIWTGLKAMRQLKALDKPAAPPVIGSLG